MYPAEVTSSLTRSTWDRDPVPVPRARPHYLWEFTRSSKSAGLSPLSGCLVAYSWVVDKPYSVSGIQNCSFHPNKVKYTQCTHKRTIILSNKILCKEITTVTGYIGLPKAPGLASVFGDCSWSGEAVFRNFSDNFALKNGSRSGSYFLETASGVRPGDL